MDADKDIALEHKSLGCLRGKRASNNELQSPHPLRQFCVWLCDQSWYGNGILVLIMANCIILAMQTPTSGAAVVCKLPEEPELFEPIVTNPVLLGLVWCVVGGDMSAARRCDAATRAFLPPSGWPTRHSREPPRAIQGCSRAQQRLHAIARGLQGASKRSLYHRWCMHAADASARLRQRCTAGSFK